MMMFFSVIVAIFVAAAEIDICVSSFPVINDVFGLSPFQTEFLLSFNLFANAISALFMGNLGDKYGKKQIILASILTFIMGSILSAMGSSFIIVLLGRILQGVGAAGPLVLGPLIVLDLYQGQEQQNKMNITNGVCTLGISFAPLIGSYSTMLFGWRSNFMLLVVLGAVSLILCYYFLPHDKQNNTHVSLSVTEYFSVFKSKMACVYLLCVSLSIAAYYVFVGMGSIVYVDSLGVSLKHFGLYQGAMAFVFGILSLFSGRIVKKIGNRAAFFGSLAIIAVFYVLIVLAILFNIKNPLLITTIMLISTVGYVVPLNLLYVLALGALPNAGGKMSAMLQIGKWVFTILGVQLASYFYSNDFRSTGILVVTMDCIAFIFIMVLLKKDRRLSEELCKT